MRFTVILLATITLTIAVSSVLAQTHSITEAEFKALKATASEKRKGLPVRMKTTTTGYEPGSSSELLAEYGPENRTYHYITVLKENGVETRKEGISIGWVWYTRNKDGSWAREDPKAKDGGGHGTGSGTGSGIGTGIPPIITIEHLYVGEEKINGKEAAHYRRTQLVKFIGPPAEFWRNVSDYWFSKDGFLVKDSYDEEGLGKPNQHRIGVTEYEYDNSIEITAPIPD